jgi:anti-sigma factor RsiW
VNSSVLPSYLDAQLPKRDRLRLEAHLGECPHCSEYLEQLRVTIASLGRAEPEVPGDNALRELVDLYRRWRAEI